MEAGAIRAAAHARGHDDTSTTARRRPTAPRGWSPRCSGCCFSSSRRSWSSGPSSRPTSSSGSWRARSGRPRATELPKLIAGVNTAILLSSSFTLHWAEHAHKQGNRRGLQVGMLTTFLLGATFLFVQINEYVHIGFSPQDSAQGTIFYGLTGLHGAHVFIGLTLLAFVTIRAFRGHFTADGAPRHRGARDLLALRRRDVDRRLHDGLHHLTGAAWRTRCAPRRGVPLPALRDRGRRRGHRRRAAGRARVVRDARHHWSARGHRRLAPRPRRRSTCARCACSAGAASTCRAGSGPLAPRAALQAVALLSPIGSLGRRPALRAHGRAPAARRPRRAAAAHRPAQPGARLLPAAPRAGPARAPAPRSAAASARCASRSSRSPSTSLVLYGWHLTFAFEGAVRHDARPRRSSTRVHLRRDPRLVAGARAQAPPAARRAVEDRPHHLRADARHVPGDGASCSSACRSTRASTARRAPRGLGAGRPADGGRDDGRARHRDHGLRARFFFWQRGAAARPRRGRAAARGAAPRPPTRR